MEELFMIDRCQICTAPIYWDKEQSRRRWTCSCNEQNPSCCSDGVCEGMCDCTEDKES